MAVQGPAKVDLSIRKGRRDSKGSLRESPTRHNHNITHVTKSVSGHDSSNLLVPTLLFCDEARELALGVTKNKLDASLHTKLSSENTGLFVKLSVSMLLKKDSMWELLPCRQR